MDLSVDAAVDQHVDAGAVEHALQAQAGLIVIFMKKGSKVMLLRESKSKVLAVLVWIFEFLPFF